MLLLPSLAACSTAAIAEHASRQDAQTVVLTGETGAAGATGPAGQLAASTHLEVIDGALTLRPPQSCNDGDTLEAQSASFVCAPQAAHVNRFIAGPGIAANAETGGVTVSARFGTGADDISPAVHDHVGHTFLASSNRSIVYVDNSRNTSPSTGAYGITRVAGNPFSTPPQAIAGIVGKNVAATGGIGVIGDSATLNASGADDTRQGVAGFAGGLGAYATLGLVNGTGGIGVYGLGGSASAVGVRALANPDTAFALQTHGSVDFSTARGVVLPFTRYASTATTSAIAGCGSAEIAISGSCASTGVVDFKQLAGAGANCAALNAGTPEVRKGVTAYTAFCCHVLGGVSVTASVQCLRVAP